jgi:hypothetical protein
MSSFASTLVSRAEAELSMYGAKLEDQSPLKERIGQYWTFLNRPDLDGSDGDVPWSAAFISYMVHLAGAGQMFPYNAQHSAYFYRTINDRLLKKKNVGFWGYRPEDIVIEAGDIVGMNRGAAPPISYDWAVHHSDYASHADIVVGVDKGQLRTIGGNVGHAPGQVSTKTFTQQNDLLANAATPNQQVFVVIRSFLP